MGRWDSHSILINKGNVSHPPLQLRLQQGGGGGCTGLKLHITHHSQIEAPTENSLPFWSSLQICYTLRKKWGKTICKNRFFTLLRLTCPGDIFFSWIAWVSFLWNWTSRTNNADNNIPIGNLRSWHLLGLWALPSWVMCGCQSVFACAHLILLCVLLLLLQLMGVQQLL